MATRTVRDVLGEPENWPNIFPVSGDATIVDVIASDDDNHLVLETCSSSKGWAYSTFVVMGPDLRRAIVRAIRPGTTVEAAMGLEV